jgi:DNA-binding NtrC family response regulator
VFLDEIGELSLPVQAKFLRTLETGTGTRVGSVDPIAYDVRVVSATNAAIFGDCRRFRPELLHRINTLVLEMPPLRSHKSDIPALSASFLAEFNPDKRMAEEALDRLIAWDWPGNVRELRNVVKRAVVLSGRRELITAADIELDGLRKGSQGYLFA